MIKRRAYHAMAVVRLPSQFFCRILMKKIPDDPNPRVVVCGGQSDQGEVLPSCEMITFCTDNKCAFKLISQLPLGNLYGHTMISVEGEQQLYVNFFYCFSK